MFIEVTPEIRKAAAWLEQPKKVLFSFTETELKSAVLKLLIGIEKPRMLGKRMNPSYSTFILTTTNISTSVVFEGIYYRVIQDEEGYYLKRIV